MNRSSRREFLRIAGAASVAALGVSQSFGQTANARRPNVVLIMTDDMGYGDMGCHGNPHIRTPNLDKLHGESVRFSRFYVCPVCTPTRACLMTGRYNYRTGAIDTFRGRAMMQPGEVTLAEMLRDAGYATGIFGKWHLGDSFPMRAMDQGFQESLVHHGGGISQPSDPPGSGYYNPVLMHNGELEQREGYCTDIFAGAAIEFIQQHKEDPFFVYLATNAPHSPLTINDDLVAPYRAMGLDDNVARAYAMVTNIDDNVGRVMDALNTLGIADNTIVVFLTDNGPQAFDGVTRYNAGMRGSKATVYEGGIRVPLFVRWPAQLQGGRDVDRIAANIDLTPTLLDACGVDAPAGLSFDGVSVLPLLNGAADAWPDRNLFTQWHRGDVPEPYNNCAVIGQQYKLVNGAELYDLIVDPKEEHDIATEHPAIVAALRRAYETWFDDVNRDRRYLSPRIVLGDDRAPLAILSIQEQRGGEGGGYGNNGYWPVEVTREGAYEFVLRFDDQAFAGTAILQIGGFRTQAPLESGAKIITLPALTLPRGPAGLRAWVTADNKNRGAAFVEARRVE
ncbi:MAG: arylsulfatase [Candidatus Hydrogenedentes bacterium]|nr:arylsulfatase [Candidatus Hydrogenedentota bacterium]